MIGNSTKRWMFPAKRNIGRNWIKNTQYKRHYFWVLLILLRTVWVLPFWTYIYEHEFRLTFDDANQLCTTWIAIETLRQDLGLKSANKMTQWNRTFHAFKLLVGVFGIKGQTKTLAILLIFLSENIFCDKMRVIFKYYYTNHGFNWKTTCSRIF